MTGDNQSQHCCDEAGTGKVAVVGDLDVLAQCSLENHETRPIHCLKIRNRYLANVNEKGDNESEKQQSRRQR